MILRYQLTRQETADLQRSVFRLAPAMAFRYGPWACLAGCAMLGLSHATFWLFVGVVPALWVAMVEYAVWKHRRQATDELLSQHNDCTTELAADGITVRVPHVTTRYPWSAFESCRETSTLLLLRSSRQIVPLPKRAFASERDLDEVRAIIRAGMASRRS